MQSGKDETMKTAITGGTGFIGRPLVKTLLEGGDEVRVLSRRPADTRSTFQGARWYQGDFCHPIDPAFLSGVDTLYHLAAELNKPEEMEAVNVQGTANLLSAATKAGVRRWIQLSSIGVYGPPKGLLVTEETTPEPANEYERTKLASDRLLDETCQRSDMDYVIFLLAHAERLRRMFTSKTLSTHLLHAKKPQWEVFITYPAIVLGRC